MCLFSTACDNDELALEASSPVEGACRVAPTLAMGELTSAGNEYEAVSTAEGPGFDIRLAESVFAFPNSSITSIRTLTVSLMLGQYTLPDRSSVKVKGL